MKKLYNRLKCWILNIDRYKWLKEIKLSTGILCTHYKDNWRNTIVVKVKSIK
jgi:hypothetical protein